MSAKAWSRPPAVSSRPTPRMPGVSSTAPPPGTGHQAAVRGGVPALAVGAPDLPAPASRSVPASAFTSVDLPAPERPSSASVRPGATSSRSSSRPSPRVTLTGSTGTSGASSASCRATAGGSARGVALGQHQHRLCAGFPGQGEQAFDAGVVRRGVHRLDHRDRVHVRGQDLAGGVLVRGTADQRGPPGQHTLDRDTAVRPAPQHHPVAGARQPGRIVGGAEQHAAGQRGAGDAGGVEDGADATIGAQHPPGSRVGPVHRPVCGCEGIVPAELGQVVRHGSPLREGRWHPAVVRREPPCDGTQQRRTARFPPPPRVRSTRLHRRYGRRYLAGKRIPVRRGDGDRLGSSRDDGSAGPDDRRRRSHRHACCVPRRIWTPARWPSRRCCPAGPSGTC